MFLLIKKLSFNIENIIVISIIVFTSLYIPPLNAKDMSLPDMQNNQLLNADKTPENWLSYGRNYKEQRYSPLLEINESNIKQLNLDWYQDIDTSDGFSSTPLAIDGMIYLSAPFSKVYAVDTREGTIKWQYNPNVDPSKSLASAWSSRINRGVAYWEDKIYLATGDCRLVSLDAKSGNVIWSIKACDPTLQYSMNGAPRIANGKVYIGNSLADFGARGYIGAYDANTGKQIWKFWTVPNHPKLGEYENKTMEFAGKSWTGGGALTGGAAVWDSIVFDEEFNSIIFGTDSAAPLNSGERNPDGGDNLFTNSIVAVDADTGKYKWHYQLVPNDTWDYNANMPIILAELKIQGKERKVAMQAPKNGFFFVIDRTNGEFISANNYVPTSWASHYDKKTGRPVELPNARFYENDDGKALVYPGTLGAHNWQPMSYSPQTGLVYFAAMDTASIYAVKKDATLGGIFVDSYASGTDTETLRSRGSLIAWDPVRQTARWRRTQDFPLNGGTLATAGNLVFQGTATGELRAYKADTGQLVWQYYTDAPIIAPPISYTFNGKQYILVASGAHALAGNIIPEYGVSKNALGPSRLLAFSLEGKAKFPKPTSIKPFGKPAKQFATAEVISNGRELFNTAGCWLCHGHHAISHKNSPPDLRRSPILLSDEAWYQVVVKGVKSVNGMLGEPSLKREDSEALRSFVLEQAWEAYKNQK